MQYFCTVQQIKRTEFASKKSYKEATEIYIEKKLVTGKIWVI
jgi:hypothetical protein